MSCCLILFTHLLRRPPVILPIVDVSTADPTPQTEQVLPLSVVRGTRGYLEKVIIQANGCYEHQWYDACAVMIRRFVETLIIEVYEAKGKASDIKDGSGTFLTLKDLIPRLTADPLWTLTRDTPKALQAIKELGDRSAHNRRYNAQKLQVDKVISGLQIAAEDLLYIAGLK